MNLKKNSKKRIWKIEAKKEDKSVVDITLYGPISSESWWGDEITPSTFKKELDGLGDSVETLNIYINSPGGDVFAGQTIVNMLERHKAKKITHADGLVASIASVIFMVGEERHAPKNTIVMIHKAWSYGRGNSSDMRKLAETLDKVDETIINTYEPKVSIKRDEIIALMDAETWMAADEAFPNGFSTHIEEEIKVAASLDGNFLVYGDVRVDTSTFKNFESFRPKIVVAETENEPEQPSGPPEHEQDPTPPPDQPDTTDPPEQPPEQLNDELEKARAKAKLAVACAI